MKRKYATILLLFTLFLSACGANKMNEPITVLDHTGNEVTFPQDKPVIFFFITTYT
ncbi:hypothetical protein IM538_08985 [Cytobacillus suaedae]|nr:hypothetical protein IM538_08985 [Cytobacillus suaedae]